MRRYDILLAESEGNILRHALTHRSRIRVNTRKTVCQIYPRADEHRSRW